MTLLADIGLYILFLVEWAAYCFAVGRLVRRMQANPARGLSLAATQLAIVVSVLHIGLTLLLLGRVFSLVLLALLLAAYELGVVVGLVIRALLGQTVLSGWLFGFEIGFFHRRVMLGPAILGIAVAVGYPIGAGVAYFSLEKGSDELLFWVIVLTATTILIGVLQQLAISIAMLLSPYLDENARTQTLLGQLTTIPQPVLWVAIAYWASTDREGTLGEGDQGQFILALVVLVGLIVSLTVLPYLIGAYRARARRTSLLNRQHDWWKRLAETAEIPIRPGYAADLRALDEDLGREREAFAAEHETFFGVRDLLRDPGARAEFEATGVGFPTDAELEEITKADPRVGLDENLQRIVAATGELVTATEGDDPAASRELAEAWSKSARQRSADAQKAASAAKDAPTGRAALGFVFTPVLGVVLDQFGMLIWEELSTLAA